MVRICLAASRALRPYSRACSCPIYPTTSGALTTTVDLHATLCDVFGVTPEHRTHGQSLVPILEGASSSVREWALCGVWGREVHVADATRTFAKAPVDENRPLSMFSNRWSTMPIRDHPGLPDAATGTTARGWTAPPAPTCP